MDKLFINCKLHLFVLYMSGRVKGKTKKVILMENNILNEEKNIKHEHGSLKL